MVREYFYTIDLRGNLLHDNSIIDDSEFINYFYRQLRENSSENHTNYPYVSHCGFEINYAQALDTPIVFHHVDNGRLFYGDSLSIEFSREKLRYSPTGIIYHEAPVGGNGRLIPQVAMEVSKYIQPFGKYFSYQAPCDKFKWIINPLELQENIKILRPRAGNYCAGCGLESPHGLYLSFIFDSLANTAETWLTAEKQLEGSLGIMHGGYVSLLLDEAMGKVLSGMGIKAPTGNLNVRFRKPTLIAEIIHLSGIFIENQGRKYFLKGEIRNKTGILLAESDGLFIKTHVS